MAAGRGVKSCAVPSSRTVSPSSWRPRMARGGPGIWLCAARHEDANRVLAPIRREEEIAFVRDEYARDALQSVDRLKETIGRGVNDVDIIVRRVGDVEPRRSVMNRSVIATAILCMRRKLYGAQ